MASPSQRELMYRFSPGRATWRSVAIPQLGLNLGFDARARGVSTGDITDNSGNAITDNSGNNISSQ
jgi:hypothetical protein